MANPTVTIDSVDRTAYTSVDSVSINRGLSSRSAMRCELLERAGVYRPLVGNVIELDHNGDKKFGGYIEEIEEFAEPGNGALRYAIQAVDFTRILDWRVYAGSFENVPFYSIIETIWLAKLSLDGISLSGVINPGPTITNRIQDGLRPITEWFRKLSVETGYQFRIDANKVLHFGPLATSPANPAPFSITWASLNWRHLKIRRRIGDYRNRQYVRTEYTVTSTLTKQFVGDGSTRDFAQYDGPFHGAPTATVDTGGGPVPVVVKRLGFDPLNPGAGEWYYDVEGWGFHNFSPDAALGVGDILELTYRVRFNNNTVAEDSGEIAARAAIQNDSGVIEAIHEDRYIDTKAALDGRAQALLRQFGAIPIEVNFETDTRIEPLSSTVEPGQQLPIDLTAGPSNVNDDFIIESVESEWRAAAPADIWTHRLKCIDQEPYGERPSSREPVVAVMEKLAEAVRIGPDPQTVLTESPSPSVEDSPWKATIVDEASPLTVGTDLANHYPADVASNLAIEFVEWYAVLEIAPDTSPAGSLEFDVLRSNDDGSTWTSIFPASKPTFSAGVKRIDGSAFNIGHLYRNQRLRYDVLTADGVAGILTFVLTGRKVQNASPV